jgi:hypothetical protein
MSFLRAHVACGLFEQFARTVRLERPYAALAFDLGLEITPDILSMTRTHCADLAIYENDVVRFRRGSVGTCYCGELRPPSISSSPLDR